MYNLLISEKVNEDFSDIYHYTVLTFGLRQYDIYQEKLKSAITKLRKMPTIGHSRSDLPEEYLCFSVEQHFIIYQIDEVNKSINILRILNSKMFAEPSGDFEEQF
jgi:toxin ParE1/3/4